MTKTVTARDILKARADLAAAMEVSEKCEKFCAELAAISPLEIAFAEGAASGGIEETLEIHWRNYFHVFGQVDGARERFDDGARQAVLRRDAEVVC